MSKHTRSTSVDDALNRFRQDPEFRKEERLVKIYYQLATKIINLRSQLNMTQQDLAAKAETYQSRISKIESGEHDIRLSTLTKIAEALQSRIQIDFVPVDKESVPSTERYWFEFTDFIVVPETTGAAQFAENNPGETRYATNTPTLAKA